MAHGENKHIAHLQLNWMKKEIEKNMHHKKHDEANFVTFNFHGKKTRYAINSLLLLNEKNCLRRTAVWIIESMFYMIQ
jgi:hypothetical protein